MVAALLVTSCAPSDMEEDLAAARQAGYSEGYAVGETEGYQAGYEAGHDDGYDSGYTRGHTIGRGEGLIAGLQYESSEEELEVHFIDVGQGDSILVDLGETEILIDGGSKSPGVTAYLNHYVDGQLEVMVATHPHADHIGGLIAVLDAFDIKEVWHNGDTSTSQTHAQFIAAVQAEGAEINIARRGDEITAGGLTFIVLNPATLAGTTNNNSIVLSLGYGEIDFLFTGDAEQETEANILGAGVNLDAEILKVGHHGSRTASSQPFLAAVQPEAAVYMAGEGNSYGHPHDEAITALSEIGAEIYGTDIHGTIIITTRGKAYIVQCEIPTPPLSSTVVSPTPANFTVTNLSVSPDDVESGGTVTISATVTNTGGTSGSYTAVLRINGSEVVASSVALDAGESRVVSFTVSKEAAGTYMVEVGGLEGIFTVAEKVIQQLFLEITSVTSLIGKGYTATLQAKTVPGAHCTITVYYKSGPSSAAGLYGKTADSQGNVSWSWKVGTRTTPGSWRIVVTASLDSDTVSQTTYFTVY